MSMAEPAVLHEIGIFRQQVKMSRAVVRMNTDGVTHEESLIQPRPEGNCLNFVVGHLLNIYAQSLPLLGQEPPLSAQALHRYRRGAPPLRDGSEALPFTELLAAWDTASDRFDAGLAALTPEALERPMPGPDSKGELTETVRSLLAILMFHQAYHAGQTGVLRRIAGKPGAIP